jgi:hypothetical protein
MEHRTQGMHYKTLLICNETKWADYVGGWTLRHSALFTQHQGLICDNQHR